ncbi:MAG: hypothetical protein R2695_12060 [Acidimicrobiales bacterium]
MVITNEPLTEYLPIQRQRGGKDHRGAPVVTSTRCSGWKTWAC